jgi:hypothetical protein
MNLTPNTLITPQPAPIARTGGVSMHDVARALHAARKAHGLDKYQTLLQAANGRDPAIDGLQESLDRVVYDIQHAVERAAMAEALNEYQLAVDDPEATVQSLRDAFDDAFDPDVLAERADRIAAALIEQATS